MISKKDNFLLYFVIFNKEVDKSGKNLILKYDLGQINKPSGPQCVYIRFLLLLQQMATSLVSENNINMPPYSSVVQKLNTGLIRLKSRCCQVCAPSRESRKNSLPCHSQLLEAAHIHCLVPPIQSLKPATFVEPFPQPPLHV